MLAYDFDWSVLWRQPYGIWMLKGLGLTLGMGLASWVIALILGIPIATARVSNHRWLRILGTTYVEVFRNVPLLVQIFFWFYAGPLLFGESLGREINRMAGLNIYVAIIGIGMYTSSRVAEHVRAGFASIKQGQYQAVLSTGMTQVNMYYHLIIPYALRLSIPQLSTEFMAVFKNTSIAMTIGVAEITFQSYQIDSETFHGLEATTGAMVMYLFLGLVVVKVMGLIEGKYKIPGLIGR